MIICGGVDPDALLPLAAVKADAGSPATQTFLAELRKCSLPGFQEAFQKSPPLKYMFLKRFRCFQVILGCF